MFTADITPTPIHTGHTFPCAFPQTVYNRSAFIDDNLLVCVDEIFSGRFRRLAERPDSFAELQIAFAKAELESNIDSGERLFEGVQGRMFGSLGDI